MAGPHRVLSSTPREAVAGCATRRSAADPPIRRRRAPDRSPLAAPRRPRRLRRCRFPRPEEMSTFGVSLKWHLRVSLGHGPRPPCARAAIPSGSAKAPFPWVCPRGSHEVSAGSRVT
jgi:hypothetical protein